LETTFASLLPPGELAGRGMDTLNRVSISAALPPQSADLAIDTRLAAETMLERLPVGVELPAGRAARHFDILLPAWLLKRRPNHKILCNAGHYGSIFVPNTSKNFRIHSGCPGQAAAVTRLPSTTALENVSLTSRHTAPDRTKSGLMAG
jgi:hypothetical protein